LSGNIVFEEITENIKNQAGKLILTEEDMTLFGKF
jgi:hypothetical protein